MKKDLIIQGVACSIVLTQNAETQSVKGSDPVWHEVYTRQVSVHKCTGYIGAQIHDAIMEIEPTKVMFELFRDWTPHEIEKVVKRVEAGLEKYVIGMKERQKHQSELQEKLQQLGFL